MKDEANLDALQTDWQPVELPFSRLVHSFVSGDPAGKRIRIRYFKGSEKDVLWGRVWFGDEAEGPPKHAHGGAQAAALDEICGGAAWVWGHQVVAVKLETEFLHFVPLNTVHKMKAIISRKEGRKIFTEGHIEDAEGKILARGSVLFLELNSSNIHKLSIPPLP